MAFSNLTTYAVGMGGSLLTSIPPASLDSASRWAPRNLLACLQNEPSFCAVAAESPFPTFRELAYDRVGQFFHTGPWLGRTLLFPLVETAFAYARWHDHIDLAGISPSNAAASS